LFDHYLGIRKHYISGKSGSYIKGLLYQHNVNNYSKLTAFYRYSDEKLEHELYCGNQELFPVINDLVLKNIHNIKYEKVLSLPINGNSDLSYRLLLKKLNPDNSDAFIASVISSHYSKDETFEYLCNTLSRLYKKKDQYNSPVNSDYFSMVYSDLKDYTNACLDSGSEINAVMYKFNNFDEIFSHMGHHVISDISDEITELLRKSYSFEAKIIILSFSNYLVLVPQSPDSNGQSDADNEFIPAMLNFNYNGILFQYELENFKIKNRNDILEILLRS